MKIYQILHHEYLCLLGLIFIVFCLTINYNTSVKDKNIELGDEYMKKRILTSLITVLGIALFSFLKNHMNVSLVMSVVISSIFIVLGVLIIEFRYNK